MQLCALPKGCLSPIPEGIEAEEQADEQYSPAPASPEPQSEEAFGAALQQEEQLPSASDASPSAAGNSDEKRADLLARVTAIRVIIDLGGPEHAAVGFDRAHQLIQEYPDSGLALLLLGQAAGGLREADAPERLGPDPIRFMKRAFTIALRRLEPELREVVVEGLWSCTARADDTD